MSETKPDNRLKCRYCGFTTFKWRTTKAGKKQSGWRNLQNHMMEEHDIDVDLIGEDEP